MEDAATAEISRSQVWQWMRSPKGVLDDGRKVDRALFHEILADELRKTPAIVGADAYAAGKYAQGAKMFEEITNSEEFGVPDAAGLRGDRLNRASATSSALPSSPRASSPRP